MKKIISNGMNRHILKSFHGFFILFSFLRFSGIRFTRCVGAELSPASHGCATNVLNEIKRCMSTQHTHTTHNNNNNNGNSNYEDENDRDNFNSNESRGKKHANNIKKSTSIKSLNLGTAKQGMKTYGVDNSTSNLESTYATVRAYSNAILQLAGQSLHSGMPLLEVRYVTHHTALLCHALCYHTT